MKSNLQKIMEGETIKIYEKKEQERKLFKEQKHEGWFWLSHNFDLQKMSSYMSKLEQLFEARSWIAAKNLIEG